jgi:hypothetical protein
LEGDEISLLSEDELHARGYPSRPDASKEPEAYSEWLKAVSHSETIVTTRLPPLSGQPAPTHIASHNSANDPTAPGTSSNWSGYVLDASYRTYMKAAGTWTVPSVSPPAGLSTGGFASSFWVGLDGYGSGDVVQTGTRQNVANFGQGAFWTSYYAWYEWYPWDEASVFGVNPGDRVFGEVWRCDSSMAFNPNGGASCFLIDDFTSGTTFKTSWLDFYYAFLGGPPFVGNSAEWIMERPTVNNSITSLAPYGSAAMVNPYAIDSAGHVLTWSTDVYTALSMYNGSDLLSFPFSGPSNMIIYDWVAAN